MRIYSSRGSAVGSADRARTAAAPRRPHHHHHQPQQPLSASRRRPAAATAAAKDDAPAPIIDPQAAQRLRDLELQDDLLQHPDRCSWYEARFAGDGQPDWHTASVVANEAACPAAAAAAALGGASDSSSSRSYSSAPSSTSSSPLSWRLVTLAFEASRERVPLRNAYAEPGQTARVRSGPAMTEEQGLAVATPPPVEGEVMLPPVPRRRPTAVAAEARQRQRAAALGAAAAADDDDDEDGGAAANADAAAVDADALDFDAPWRASPYYASGALPTPRQTDRALREALFRVRGDIFANEVKTVREPVSAVAPLQLLVSPKQAPELCAARPGDLVAVGPFEGSGLDVVRAGLLAVFRYRTLVLFVGGPDAGPSAIATARALLLSAAGRYPTSLLPAMRSGGVVVYYWAPNGASVCFGQDDFDAWGSTTTMAYIEEEEDGEEEGGSGGSGGGRDDQAAGRRPNVTRHRANVRVVTTTRGFADAFDGDDDLVFDPDETAAIVLTGGDAAAEAAARRVCRDAEIAAVVSDAPEAPRNATPEYLSSIPKSFVKWAEKSRDMRAASAAREAADAVKAAEAKEKKKNKADDDDDDDGEDGDGGKPQKRTAAASSR
jgi:hypothetical protein